MFDYKHFILDYTVKTKTETNNITKEIALQIIWIRMDQNRKKKSLLLVR
jgi:hypothetical protein